VRKECEGKVEKSDHTMSTVSDVMDYLESQEVLAVINRIAAKKIAETADNQDPELYSHTTFTLCDVGLGNSGLVTSEAAT